MSLPEDRKARKALPLYDFMFKYFPDAWLEVAKVAVEGNKQHNPGEPLHWAREKSTDQLNTAFRHLFDHGTGCTFDVDGCRHLAKVVWRFMAEMQLDIERRRGYANHHASTATMIDIMEAARRAIGEHRPDCISTTLSPAELEALGQPNHHGVGLDGHFHPSDNCTFNDGHPCDACREFHDDSVHVDTHGHQGQTEPFKSDPYTGG